MSIKVADVAALQALDPSTYTNPRIVASLNAWYLPVAAETAAHDGFQYIYGVGTGRWVRMSAAEIQPSGWTFYSLTTGSTNAVNRGQYFCASSGAEITINLPASPTVGTAVQLIQTLTGWTTRIAVNRNGEKIDNVAANINFAVAGAVATLVYTGATYGWAVDCKQGYASDNAVTTLTYASDGDTNGVLYYIGTNRNTGAFSNPASGSIKINNYGVSSSPALQTGLSDRAAGIVSQSYGTDYYLLDLAVDSPRALRLTQLSLRNSSTASHALRGFAIYGGNAADWTDRTNTFAGGLSLHKVAFEKIAQFDNDTSMAASTSSYGLYNVNASKFYSLFKIAMTQQRSDGSANGNALGEWEWYGDLYWPA